VLDKAECSAFESTLNSAIVSYRVYSVPLLQLQWLDVLNDTLSNPANFTPLMWASLLYAADQRVAVADLVISVDFRSECGCAKCFFSQNSKPNELIFNTVFNDSVCLKDPHG